MKQSKKTKFHDQEEFLLLFRKFIHDSQRGIRLQKNGQRIKMRTVDRYICTFKLLENFTKNEDFQIKLFLVNNLTKKELGTAKKHWKQFYSRFTDFLYKKGYFDNYVGLNIRILRVFMNYLIIEKQMPIGLFNKSFYIPKDDIPVIALRTEQLSKLINDRELEQKLPDDLKIIKDIFVFGCTVGLRISDIMNLKPFNLERSGDEYYLKVKSKKTGTDTRIKLPGYAVDILKKYRGKQTTLLPVMSNWYFNKQLKEMAAYLDAGSPLIKVRMKKGLQTAVYKHSDKKHHYTLADHISSHTMRRTAITTMLSLGMPEQLVRKISGHAANSREFYKYVSLAQTLQDAESDKVFNKLAGINA